MVTPFCFDLLQHHNLETFIRTIVNVPGFLDLTVTDPYKEQALRIVRNFGPEAAISENTNHIGVLNHIIRSNNENLLYALNTDGIGMIASLKSKMSLKGKNALLIGAGGSSRAIGYELVREGIKLHIANRTVAKAEQLAYMLKPFAVDQSISCGSLDDLGWLLESLDIVVAAITKGSGLTPSQFAKLRPDAVIADTRYGAKAELVTLASASGNINLDGQWMLFGQFVEAANAVKRIHCVEDSVFDRALESIKRDFYLA